MRSKSAWFTYCFILFLCGLWFIPVPRVNAQGQIRAMQERADEVSKRKNRFVAMVLDHHNIGYFVDRHGTITRISVTGNWLEVMKLDVVPMVRQGAGIHEVIGHEVFIFTQRETLRLVSYLRVR